MITELELALCYNRNLDDAGQMLRERANNERAERLQQIDRDLALAKLIREGLNEPIGSAPYSICKCYIRWFKKKNRINDNLAWQLLKEAQGNACDVINNLDDLDVIDNPDDDERSDDHDGTGETGTECTGVQTAVSEAIPAEKQGKSKKIQS